MLNIDKGKKYLLACSFGPDSMALFDMLKKQDFYFEVAHVNYHLRNESDFEEKSLRKYCEENDIKIHVFDVKEVPSKNIEEIAREIRYSFFFSIINKQGFHSLLIAHHQDDLLETYIMQKMRNILPKYYGIKEISYQNDVEIVRPLLNYTKSELLDYVNNNHIPYSVDKTNLSDVFLRNKIRHTLVSVMKREKRLEMLKEISDKNKEIAMIEESNKTNDVCSLNYLFYLDDVSFAYTLMNIVRNKLPGFEMSFSFVKEIKKALQSKKARVKIKLNHDCVLLKEYEHIELIMGGDINYSYTYEKPSTDDNEIFYMNFINKSDNRNVYLDSYPITIRNALPKDKVMIKNYFVEVRRLFIDWKVPLSLRKKWPVILDKNGNVIYIPRYQPNFVPDSECNFYIK